MMYTRCLTPPDQSFFLLGPRATGKTTFLQQHYGTTAKWYNLLRATEYLRLAQDPGAFHREVLALPKDQWVVIDEVQKLPALLDEVQDLITQSRGHRRFILSGSSARRLKRKGANLLAGRAVNRKFFPLVAKEYDYSVSPKELLAYGTLPLALTETRVEQKVDFLESYVANYVREEIQQEAAVKNLESFSRFLKVAGGLNGQVINVSGVSRDAEVARPSVKGYFDVLTETLLGTWLPAWRPRFKVKEVEHPKFYFFDPGVVRAIQNRTREPMTDQERGFLFETLIFHELRAWTEYHNIGGEWMYWATPSDSEVDFLWVRGKKSVGFEIKSGTSWRPEYSATLRQLIREKKIQRGYGVYLGERALVHDGIKVFPWKEFSRRLAEGELLT